MILETKDEESHLILKASATQGLLAKVEDFKLNAGTVCCYHGARPFRRNN